MAWWAYDAPFPYPGYDHEQAALYEANLLAEEEKAELLTQWRLYFDKAQEPGFGFCTGRVNHGLKVPPPSEPTTLGPEFRAR
jgi:hypothetical protein